MAGSALARVAGATALSISLAAAPGGCTRIPRQTPDDAVTEPPVANLDPVPLPRPGDPLPDLAYADQGGRRRLSEHRGKAVVLTFLSRHCLNRGTCGELPRRLAEAREGLRDELARRTVFVIVSTDPLGDSAADLRRAAERDGVDLAHLSLAFAAESELRTLLDASGVVVWRNPDGSVEHNYETLVIAPSGRVADRFPGIEGWSSDELRAAVAAAAHRSRR